jgi:hypothetical protein
MSWQESLGKNLIKNVEVKIGDNKTIGVDTINTERDYERNDIIEKPVHIGVDTINTENKEEKYSLVDKVKLKYKEYYERNDIISVSYKQKKGKTFIIREIIRNMKHIPKGIVFYQQTEEISHV